MDAPRLDLSVLTDVLPNLAQPQARAALLGHLLHVASNTWAAPLPSKMAEWMQAVEGAARAAHPQAEREQWIRLSEALREKFPPWSTQCGWGWNALGLALQAGEPDRAKALLSTPGAPTGQQLSRRTIPIPDRKQAPSLTLMGWILDRPTSLTPLLKLSIGLGVDVNAPTGPGCPVPLAAAFDSSHVRILRENGATLGGRGGLGPWIVSQPSPDGVQALPNLEALTTLDRLKAQLTQWNEILAEGRDQGFAGQVRQLLPDLTRQLGYYLATRHADIGPSLSPIVRQFRSVGRKVGVDVLRPGPTDPCLQGEWAAALLVSSIAKCGTKNKNPLDLIKDRALPLQAVDVAQTGGQPWRAQVRGFPASVWGWLLALLNEKAPQTPFPDRWTGAAPELQWWDQVGQALDSLESRQPLRPEAFLKWRVLSRAFAPMASAGVDSLRLWRKWASEELDWVLQEQNHSSQLAPCNSPNGYKVAARTPPQLWLPMSKAWRNWDPLLRVLTNDFFKNSEQYVPDTPTRLLQAHVLTGLAFLPQAMELLRQFRETIDIDKVKALADSPLARAKAGISTPAKDEFWMELKLSFPSRLSSRIRF